MKLKKVTLLLFFVFCFLYTAFDVDYVMFAMNVLKYFICVIVSSVSVVGINII